MSSNEAEPKTKDDNQLLKVKPVFVFTARHKEYFLSCLSVILFKGIPYSPCPIHGPLSSPHRDPQPPPLPNKFKLGSHLPPHPHPAAGHFQTCYMYPVLWASSKLITDSIDCKRNKKKYREKGTRNLKIFQMISQYNCVFCRSY